MKKFLFLIVLFIAACFTSFAQKEVVYLKNGNVVKGSVIEQVPNESIKIQTQDGSIFVYQNSEITKITKEEQNSVSHYFSNRDKALKSGYRGFVDFGYIFGGFSRIELLTTHGYQFNPYIFAGVGVGLNYISDVEDFVVPIFADVRGTFLKGNITPFVDLKIGYSVADMEGFYMEPSVGCRFEMGRNLGLNISLAYTLQKYSYSGWNDYYEDSNGGSGNAGGISLKVGLDF